MSLLVGVVNPKRGPSRGSQIVKLLGADFVPGRTRVYFGDWEAQSLQHREDHTIYARTPAVLLVDERGKPLAERLVDVTVTTYDELGEPVASSVKANAYTFERDRPVELRRVVEALLDVLRSILPGQVYIDQAAHLSTDGLVVSPAQLPAAYLEGPLSSTRDGERSDRGLASTGLAAGEVREQPTWARRLDFEVITISNNRGEAQDLIAEVQRWLDEGQGLNAAGVRAEVYESTVNTLRAIQVAGQDYARDRVVAYRIGFEVVGVELDRAQVDVAVAMNDPSLALGEGVPDAEAE